MRTIVVVLALLPTIALAETRAWTPATKDKLIGRWEALVPKENIVAAGVYQMSFPKKDVGYLVEVLPDIRPGKGCQEEFFAQLKTCELTSEGRIKMRFAVLRHSSLISWESVEFDGFAGAEGENGVLSGTLTFHGSSDEKKDVHFLKGQWIHYLADCSRKAEEILHRAGSHK